MRIKFIELSPHVVHNVNNMYLFHSMVKCEKLINCNSVTERLIVLLPTSHSSVDYVRCHFATKNETEPVKKRKILKNEFSEKEVKKIDLHNSEEETLMSDEMIFSDIFRTIEKTYTKNYVKDCEWRLYNWGKTIAEKKNAKEEINLDKIVFDSINSVVELVLTPSVPPYMRHKCLALLLNDKNDRKSTEKILKQTAGDVIMLPVSVVADIIHELTVCAETPLRKETRTELVKAVVNKRWYEIPARYLLFFMYQLDSLFDMRDITQKFNIRTHESKHLAKEGLSGQLTAAGSSDNDQRFTQVDKDLPDGSINLETRVLNLVDELKGKDLAKVLILMGRWKNRNPVVLSAVIHRLNMADLSDFSFVQLNNMLFACSLLNYRNENFLGKLTSQLSLLAPESGNVASTVMTSLSHLRWRNDDLISTCKKAVFDDLNILSPKDAKNTLLSFANLTYLPADEKELNFVRALAQIAMKEDFTPVELVNCGWCLAVLKALPVDQAKNLLKPDFVKEVLASSDGYLKQIAVQKLAVISFVAKYEMNDYKGAFLSDDILSSVEMPSFCCDKTLSDTFQKAVGKFADMNSYVLLRQTVEDGFRIDCIMNANKLGDVRPLKVGQSDQQSEEIYRLAIQLVPFTGVIGPAGSPVGSYLITSRFLRHLGYTPVHITYLDLKPTLGVLEHINNITAKIKSAVRERHQ
ncbi:hypothetical protein Btru_051210 [Bulinus truncatus]|nr:hypothetical protein Btru_051210 [Bulinus truncatus]